MFAWHCCSTYLALLLPFAHPCASLASNVDGWRFFAVLAKKSMGNRWGRCESRRGMAFSPVISDLSQGHQVPSEGRS